ncbi:MAG: two-component regulator propeller domain-containing protein, partial [Chitinispirillia bacterium]
YNTGLKASQTKVYLIPEEYNPVIDDPIDSTMITQTDAEGQYVFSKIPPGNYNIMAYDKITDKCSFISSVPAPKQDTNFLNIDTLKSPGSIKVMVIDTFNTNGYFFIRGTNIYTSLKKGFIVNNGFISLTFNNIPQATFNLFEYTLKDRNFKPMPIGKSVKVQPHDTALVQCHKVYIVKGQVVYESGVYASGVHISILPDNYVPTLDNMLPHSMSVKTNSKGEFFIKISSKGTYNIHGIHPVNNTQFFRSNVIVDKDTTVLNPSILKKTGKIKIILPDSLDRQSGYVYIEGTNIHKTLNKGKPLNNGFYSLTVDSVPDGTYPTLYYRQLLKGKDPVDLTSEFTVKSNTCIMLEAFVTWSFYKTDNSGLPSNIIFDMAIDSTGSKWFATNKGAVKYTGKEWIVFNEHNSGLGSDKVINITVDKKGVIWFGTPKGVAKYNGKNWNSYNSSNTQLTNDFINKISPDKLGNIWICTNEGAAYFNTNSEQILFPIVFPFKEIFNMAIDYKGVKWFITKQEGLIGFDDISSIIYETSNSGLISDKVYIVKTDRHGDKWIGGKGGVTKFDGKTWKQVPTTSIDYETDKSECTVISIAIDQNDIKYFGTYTGGRVFVYNNHQMRIYDSESSIIPRKSYQIQSIVVDEDNNKWICTSREGVYTFGPNK